VELAIERVLLPTDKSPERRASVRFPLILDLRYVVLGYPAPAESGSGRIIELSSAGLSFTAERPLSIGQKVDISIDWPVLLDGSVPLQLIMSGNVVRSDGSAVALKIERYEFRTRRSGLKVALPQEAFGGRGRWSG
jgi:hypothetical protein